MIRMTPGVALAVAAGITERNLMAYFFTAVDTEVFRIPASLAGDVVEDVSVDATPSVPCGRLVRTRCHRNVTVATAAIRSFDRHRTCAGCAALCEGEVRNVGTGVVGVPPLSTITVEGPTCGARHHTEPALEHHARDTGFVPDGPDGPSGRMASLPDAWSSC